MTSLTHRLLGSDSTGRTRACGGRPFGRAVLVALGAFLVGVAQTALAVPQQIRLGDTCVGSLESGQNSFPLYAIAGTDLRVSVRAGGGLLADVAVYDPDGSALPGAVSTNAMGNYVVFRGPVAASGLHTVAIEARNGTSGTYTMRTAGRLPALQVLEGSADSGDEQWFEFGAMAGTQIASISVRSVEDTLSLDQPGTLLDPSGAPVALGKQKATGRTLVAAKATATSEGAYSFRFTPTGSGEWIATVRLKVPRTTGATLQVPAGTIPLSRAGSGVRVGVSTPPNGTHFVAGDRPWVGIVLNDDAGGPLSLSQLSACNLYFYGPQDPLRTVTASGLLRASVDRTASPHHYINLLTNPDVQTYGNVLLYPLSAVSTEAAGTYTASVWARLAADNLQQWFPVADAQIGTATTEARVVEKANCAACHLGSVSGKFYMHHVDPGYSPTGNWSIDSWPIRTCKSCHNNDGYAGYDNRTGSGDANVDRTTDPIVRRVHGVHMGEGLENAFDNDPVTGDFKDYIEVKFPADARNCTACHVDDRWKTAPSRMACGACHDNVWFGDPALMPADREAHEGGRRDDDTACAACHPASGGEDGIVETHLVAPPAFQYVVTLSLSAPGNGTHYVAGETPVATITVANAATGATVPPSTMTETAFKGVNLYVSGPRGETKPVLTTAATTFAAARAYATNGTAGPWNLSGSPTFLVNVDNGGVRTLTAAPGLFADPAAATPAEVVAWLAMAGPTGVGDVATVTTSSSKVTIKSNQRGAASSVEIQASAVATAMGWAVAVNGPLPKYYASNDLRVRTDPLDEDSRVTRSPTQITYQLADVAGLAAGTYTAFVDIRPAAGFGGNAFVNLQVGTATAEPKPATGCTDCHGTTTMHATSLNVAFNPDICKNCHDYKREGTGFSWAGVPPKGTNGTSTSGWSGYGAMPLAKRLHGVHRGAYLDHPEEVKPGDYTVSPDYDFSKVIFPQDIRNCTKCHSANSVWTQKPSRLACLACHDGSAAQAHGQIMTYDPTPTDPWSGDEQESCGVCHGEDAEFAPSKVHAVSNPYVPPYPREK